MIKYDRNGYHARPRVMFVTNAAIYIVQEKDFKLKDKIPFLNLSGEYVFSYTHFYSEGGGGGGGGGGGSITHVSGIHVILYFVTVK